MRSVNIKAVVLCLILVGIASCSQQPSEVQESAADHEPAAVLQPAVQMEFTDPESLTSGGYSIFNETMVDMTWQEIEKAVEEGAIVLLNTAVIEEHGPHMVCGIDSYLGSLWCKLTRRKLEALGVSTVTAPPFYWGINRSSHVFPGTFTVQDGTLESVLHDTFESLKSWGFDRVFTINSHGDGAHNAVIIETIFNRPGMGKFVAFAAQQLDYAGILGGTIFFSLVLIVGNLIVDVLYAVYDPRIQLG